MPDGATSKCELPTIYLLHGYSGNYKSWLEGFDTNALVDQYGVIAVMPDGDFDSWYLDSPIDETMQFETFISSELVEWIDAHYPTIASREGRAITGLSMGGHGALYNAFRHHDIFGAAGSMSGGVDIRPFPNNWNISDVIGKMDTNPENWERFSVINQLHLLDPQNPIALAFDCGTEDFFYEVNENLHDELLKMGYPHRYSTDVGAHNLPYWQNALHYHFLYFSRFFDRRLQK